MQDLVIAEKDGNRSHTGFNDPIRALRRHAPHQNYSENLTNSSPISNHTTNLLNQQNPTTHLSNHRSTAAKRD